MVSMRRSPNSSSTSWLSSRITQLLAAFIFGMVLVQLQTLFFDNDIITVHSSPLYAPGLRTSAFGPQCRYYLAESAIPKGGLGIFTAVGVPPGEVLSIPDICIYVADTPEDIQLRSHSYGRNTFFGQFEGDNSRAACEGLATLMNTMPVSAINSKLVSPKKADNAGLDRRTSPGAGSITHYYGIETVSLDTIVGGEELTHDYGDWDHTDYEKAHAQKPKRPVPWLRENGWCIDNIDIGPATDPVMGRGAFATRALKQGIVVAPAPIQVYPKRQDFTVRGKEALIVNYCFQAAGSDMLFFPYGPAVNLINHSRRKPNVKIQWARDSVAHPQWLDLPLKDFWELTYPGGIMLEVVALRDIQEGEELYMNYGDAWEDAWNTHIATWTAASGQLADYAYPGDMDETALLRTVEEQKKEPYAKNLGLMCETPVWDREPGRLTWREPTWSWGMEGYVHCHVLEREKGGHGAYMYTVALTFDHNAEFDPSIKMEDRYIDVKVPRRAIRFADKPYTSDEYLPSAFRHPIVLPNELFPQQWKKKW